MSKSFIILNYLIMIMAMSANSILQAHEGHTHAASPTASSSTKFSGSINGEDPLSVNFKLRSGYEFGQYVGAIPSLNSYFGDEELNLNLNYEFQFREFATAKTTVQKQSLEDRDLANRFSAKAQKSITNKLSFSITGEYDTSQAVRLARMINDYNSTSVRSNLTYNFNSDWNLAANYVFSLRQYPNGTYLIPSSSPKGIGEPIIPGEQLPAKTEVTVLGITDQQNEAALSLAGELGEQTLILEGKAILNNSDLDTRVYNAGAFKLGFEKMLWSRIYAQTSFSLESRTFSNRTDHINTMEFGLQKDLSARLSILGTLRNNQTESVKTTSWMEGYAQLQYGF